MPSPFPGMDPYIEDRSIWPSMHQRLITAIADSIMPDVLPKYMAHINERVEIAGVGSSYVPDVMVVKQGDELRSEQVHPGALVADTPTILGYLEPERIVPYVEIIHRETRDVVTIIEILSPGNKVGREREKYLAKQEDVVRSYTNLVEIDLLSYGRDTTLARSLHDDKLDDWRYTISVSRANRRTRIELYSLALTDRLPRPSIPLRAADPDIVLDLPAIFNRCYDSGRYDLMVDYDQPPSVMLSQEESEWVEQHLSEVGLRNKV
ncbi:MAG: DUF4058 family protein [Chloroflexota bacterium]